MNTRAPPAPLTRRLDFWSIGPGVLLAVGAVNFKGIYMDEFIFGMVVGFSSVIAGFSWGGVI